MCCSATRLAMDWKGSWVHVGIWYAGTSVGTLVCSSLKMVGMAGVTGMAGVVEMAGVMKGGATRNYAQLRATTRNYAQLTHRPRSPA